MSRLSIQFAVAVIAALGTPAVSGAQATSLPAYPASYLSVAAGAAIEPDQFSVRSALGVSFGISVGRSLSSQTALEARAGGEYFGAPTQFVSPGGCLGQMPCNPPQASAVKVITLGGDAIISQGPHSTGPMLLIGLGARRVSESPERSSDMRPFLEIGGGMAKAIGSGSLGVEVRYQRATSGANLPSWMMPIDIVARLF